MKRSHRRCKTPPSVTVKVKPSNSSRSLQARRGLWLRGAGGAKAPRGASQRSRCWDVMYHGRAVMPPTIVIHRQEMTSFFRLFNDDLIQDFLWMDSCYKMSDKYLLAMTFVYFKRAHFTTAEYTRKNLFIALYLANTMEEDEEESKYEIFPWALGKSWRKEFPSFLQQRDKLWARIQFRAAVSRWCCDEVMTILPAHFLWRRERSERHGGARRQGGAPDGARFPRGPTASPVSCAICKRDSRIREDAASCSRGTSTQRPHPLTVSLEVTPPRAAASRKNALEPTTSCHCAEKVPRDESCSAYDTSMDWICEE
ncbi:speedy protein A [Brachionichthys hirsutus]|uniref:speedy protein A n=1 Tax=Brachionichthys hirsutus TaxID=412623 RepID=UPI00360530E1